MVDSKTIAPTQDHQVCECQNAAVHFSVRQSQEILIHQYLFQKLH